MLVNYLYVFNEGYLCCCLSLPPAVPFRGSSFLCLSKETNQRKDTTRTNLHFYASPPRVPTHIPRLKIQVRTARGRPSHVNTLMFITFETIEI
jgi:hypothetical protein